MQLSAYPFVWLCVRPSVCVALSVYKYCDGSFRICLTVRGYAQRTNQHTGELITLAPQGLSEAAITEKRKTVFVIVNGKAFASLFRLT